MPDINCGHAVGSKCYGHKLLFSSSLYYKFRLLPSKPSAVIPPPFATIPVLHLSICPYSKTWGSVTITGSSVQCWETVWKKWDCQTSLISCSPGSYVRTCWGLWEAIQTPNWWDHSCSLSHALTLQTLCPFLSSRTNNMGNIFEVACWGEASTSQRQLAALNALN